MDSKEVLSATISASATRFRLIICLSRSAFVIFACLGVVQFRLFQSRPLHSAFDIPHSQKGILTFFHTTSIIWSHLFIRLGVHGTTGK